MQPKRRAKLEDLTEKQQKFVELYVSMGGTREAATEAYMLAFGQDNKSYASRSAGRLLKDQRVQEVLVDETVSSFSAQAVIAADKLGDIIQTGMWFGQAVKPNDGLKAISMALERSVGPIAMLHKHEHEHSTGDMSPEQIRSQIFQELALLSDADKHQFLTLLKGDDTVIEIEALEVDPDAPWGRKKDGTPKEKPGREANAGKRVLPGPEAYKPPEEGELQKRIRLLKEKKLREMRKEVASDDQS